MATGGSRRYGRYIRLEERRLKLGQYLFLKHGGKVVFLGRFVSVMRAWAAFLAGTNRMAWPRFLFFNAAGGILWASLYGLGGYFLGDNIHRLTGPVGIVLLVLAVLLILAGLLILHRKEQRLADEAQRALPGPLDAWPCTAHLDALGGTAQGFPQPPRSGRCARSELAVGVRAKPAWVRPSLMCGVTLAAMSIRTHVVSTAPPDPSSAAYG